MLWYFKNKQCYEYPLNQILNNSLTQRFHKSVYENSNEMELYYALYYMKENFIPALSVIFPIEDLSVNYGVENDINKEYCDNNNIHYRFEQRTGGCMVLFPGNIITLDVYPADNFLKQHAFMHDFVDYLQTKGINATTNNNYFAFYSGTNQVISCVTYSHPCRCVDLTDNTRIPPPMKAAG